MDDWDLDLGPELENHDYDEDDDDYIPGDGEEYAPPDDDSDDHDANNLEKAEIQMAGDFNRLIGRIQNEDLSTNDNMAWQFDINEDQNFDIEEELRLGSGIGKRKTRRPRGQPEVSATVRNMYGEASEAYVNQKLNVAIPMLREIIKIEPAFASAWTTLAQCHRELGQEQQALQLDIIGAHLMEPDVEVWRDLGRRSKDLDYVQQAIYCFRKILYIDPDDLDALWDRSYLLKLSGQYKKALDGFLKILSIQPGNPDVLEEVRALSISLDRRELAIKLFQEAFDHFKKVQPDGPENPDTEFSRRHIIVLSDFYIEAQDYEKAIFTIRSGARWLNGRLGDGSMWDFVQDDREFDLEGFVREHDGEGPLQGFYDLDVNLRQRLAISRLKIGDLQEAEMHASIILARNVLEYAVLFQELAAAYFEAKIFTEALRIYLDLAAHDETTSLLVLLRIAACHQHLRNFDEAIEVLCWARTADPDDIDTKFMLAQLYEVTGQPQKALPLVLEVAEAKNREASTRGKSTKGARGPVEENFSLFDETQRKPTLARSRQSKINKEELILLEKQRQAAVELSFAKVEAAEEAMLQGDRAAIDLWLQEAGVLTEDFRVTRQLFLSDKRATFRGIILERQNNRNKNSVNVASREDAMASRLQLEIAENAAGTGPRIGQGVTVFRGVSFDRWKLMITQYAFLLTREGDYALADEVLRHMMQSNVFMSVYDQTTFRMALLACAMRAGDHNAVVQHNRRLCAVYQFNNDGLRLMLASLGSGLQATESYIDSKLQKNMAREIRLMDRVVSQGLSLRWSARTSRYVAGDEDGNAGSGDDEAQDDPPGEGSADGDVSAGAADKDSHPSYLSKESETRPPAKFTKLSPVALVNYGQICLGARSLQSAIWYLLQAYELQPTDPLICLDLAVACLGRAMQRQADNRNHFIVESFSFLSKYRTYRKAEHPIEDEIEYNFGRAFHQIGLNSLAVKHYEAALDIISRRLEGNPDNIGCAREAAYNLSIIYVANGSPRLAKTLYQRWLSL